CRCAAGHEAPPGGLKDQTGRQGDRETRRQKSKFSLSPCLCSSNRIPGEILMSLPIPWPDLEQRLRGHVEALAGTPRPMGTAAHAAARGYIRQHLTQAGFVCE